jgi:biotin operon repressor
MAKIKWTKEKDKKLLDLLKKGKTSAEAGKALKVSASAISGRVKRFKDAGIIEVRKTRRSNRKYGPKHEDEFAKRMNKGETLSSIARSHNTTSSVVKRVLTRMIHEGNFVINKMGKYKRIKKDNPRILFTVLPYDEEDLGPKDCRDIMVKKAFDRMKNNLDPNKFWTEEREEKLIKMYLKGDSYSSIGYNIGTTSVQVGKKIQSLRLAGVELPYRVKNSEEKTRKRIIRNIVKKYGEEGLDSLIGMFEMGFSGEAIAKEFNVTRQRIHQWKTMLFETKVSYKEDEDIQKVKEAKVLEGGVRYKPSNPLDPEVLIGNLNEEQKKKVSQFIVNMLLEQPFSHKVSESDEEIEVSDDKISKYVKAKDISNYSIF